MYERNAASLPGDCHASLSRDMALMQFRRRLERGSCSVGEDVDCPGSAAKCSGESCCPGANGGDSFPCPSAPQGWGSGKCESSAKIEDCVANAPAAEDVLVAQCTAAEKDPWATGSEIPCCAGLQPCLGDWSGRGTSYFQCLESCSAQGSSNVPSPSRGLAENAPGSSVRLLSFNVWHGNHRFGEIADLIQGQVDPDVVNLQEAVNQQPADIVEALNAQGKGQWQLANAFDASHFWCGLNAYRSDKWDLEWTKEIRYQGSRGICGARLRRKSDNLRLCVWGTHPTWYKNGPASSAQEGVRAGAAAMKECATSGAQTAFMCDCNTHESDVIVQQLEQSTGWQWGVAHEDGYDQIYVPQTASTGLKDTIAPDSGKRGCQASCQNPAWAYSDHPPVYADVTFQ
jgi:hypothetical protein